jgi:hypothetical protein
MGEKRRRIDCTGSMRGGIEVNDGSLVAETTKRLERMANVQCRSCVHISEDLLQRACS